MLYYLAVAICLGAIMQLGMWVASSLQQLAYNRQQFKSNCNAIHQQIREATTVRTVERPQTDVWNGFREFYVDRLDRPATGVTSVYLKPVDGKPIKPYNPGQHLPLRFNIPGEPKPVVRCYSLSSGPGTEFYRISVKQVATPTDRPELPPGKVSNFINKHLKVGDNVEAKSPAGSFVLDQQGSLPVVLLAGGIGITPLYSMLEHLAIQNTNRLVVLFYGVRNGREHTFKDEIATISNRFPNIHAVTCYSQPDSTDRFDQDYLVNGHVGVELLKKLLPNNQCEFYLCGSPPFMKTIRDGLEEWRVPDSLIKYEAFGPASIKKKQKPAVEAEKSAGASSVKFSLQNKECQWNPSFESVLELAEANDVVMDFGCRAGSCGTCAARLVDGTVEYPDGFDADCGSDEFLPCVAKPASNIELEV